LTTCYPLNTHKGFVSVKGVKIATCMHW
jgi:hypothetical protein